MAIRNNALSMYQDQKKKNSLQPYLDAGNASTQPKTEATRVSPTYTPNTVAKAYSAPKTASTAVPLQSAVAKAYNQPAQQSVPAQTAQNVPKATASMSTPAQNTNTPTLQQAYGNTGSYGSARQNALNQAEASYNKLLNYLPEYMELLGMGGLGVSNQALLNAYGTYQQNVNDINAQYDELERANKAEYRDAINALSGELSAYLTEVGSDFNIEDYNARKQAYINSGMYTAEEIAAAEALMKDSEKNIIAGNILPEATSEEIQKYGITGQGILASSAEESDFGNFYDTGKVGSKQHNLVQDILTAASNGKIKNGTYVDFNYGAGEIAGKIFVYYNGYFYPTKYSYKNLPKDVSASDIIGRGEGLQGRRVYKDPNVL